MISKIGIGCDQTFLQREHTDGQSALGKCSPSVTVKEMQVPSAERCHVAPSRIESSKHEHGEGVGALVHCWQNTSGAAASATVLELPKLKPLFTSLAPGPRTVPGIQQTLLGDEVEGPGLSVTRGFQVDK